MAGPVGHHMNGLSWLLESEEFSDCKLICGPYHFNLHKAILASQSNYFKAAFKQGTFKEGDSGVIELKTAQSAGETSGVGDDAYDEPEIVKLMVEYFYRFDYLRGATPVPTTSSKGSANAEESASILQFPEIPSQVYILEHAKVFAIAVKYQIEGLRDLAASKFEQAAKLHWNHEDFVHSIFVAFNSTPEEVTHIREVVVGILHKHFDDLKSKAEVETVICNTPRLAYALLIRSRAGHKNGGMETMKEGQSTGAQR